MLSFIVSFPFIYVDAGKNNTQQTLFTLVKNWTKSLDNKEFGDAKLMDHSKSFDTLNHDVLIAKLHAYGFQYDACKLPYSYLTMQLHRTKLNMPFGSLEELMKGVT